MKLPLVYVVDDDARLGDVLKNILKDSGFDCESFPDGGSALQGLNTRIPDLMMLDYMLPDTDGVELLRKIRESQPDLPVVMMSGQGTIRAAVHSIQLGAYDFLEKPLAADRVKLSIRNAFASGQMRKQIGRLKQELEEQFQMIGDSAAMQRVRSLIVRVAPTTAKCVVTGESGVGKELVARAIHLKSPRVAEPFAALNCAAIPRELIESELFGYEKGAFTGAGTARRGKLQEAEGGTLFLDEIGDMSTETQAKLLRFLENMEIQRLGSSGRERLDVRVIAATNKVLSTAISQGAFREDLYHRLNVITINVPPVRERAEDIEPLARHFLAYYCRAHNRSLEFHPDCWQVLRSYQWPGNVRELRNVVERAVVLAMASPVPPDELRAFMGSAEREPVLGTLEAAVARAEREALERALAQARGSMTEAARILGIERPSIYRIMKRHGMSHPHSGAD